MRRPNTDHCVEEAPMFCQSEIVHPRRYLNIQILYKNTIYAIMTMLDSRRFDAKQRILVEEIINIIKN